MRKNNNEITIVELLDEYVLTIKTIESIVYGNGWMWECQTNEEAEEGIVSIISWRDVCRFHKTINDITSDICSKIHEENNKHCKLAINEISSVKPAIFELIDLTMDFDNKDDIEVNRYSKSDYLKRPLLRRLIEHILSEEFYDFIVDVGSSNKNK